MDLLPLNHICEFLSPDDFHSAKQVIPQLNENKYFDFYEDTHDNINDIMMAAATIQNRDLLKNVIQHYGITPNMINKCNSSDLDMIFEYFLITDGDILSLYPCLIVCRICESNNIIIWKKLKDRLMPLLGFYTWDIIFKCQDVSDTTIICEFIKDLFERQTSNTIIFNTMSCFIRETRIFDNFADQSKLCSFIINQGYKRIKNTDTTLSCVGDDICDLLYSWGDYTSLYILTKHHHRYNNIIHIIQSCKLNTINKIYRIFAYRKNKAICDEIKKYMLDYFAMLWGNVSKNVYIFQKDYILNDRLDLIKKIIAFDIWEFDPHAYIHAAMKTNDPRYVEFLVDDCRLVLTEYEFNELMKTYDWNMMSRLARNRYHKEFIYIPIMVIAFILFIIIILNISRYKKNLRTRRVDVKIKRQI